MNHLVQLVFLVIAAVVVILGFTQSSNASEKKVKSRKNRASGRKENSRNTSKKKVKSQESKKPIRSVSGRSWSGKFLHDEEFSVELNLSKDQKLLTYAAQLGDDVSAVHFSRGHDLLKDVTSSFIHGQGNGLIRTGEVTEALLEGSLSMRMEVDGISHQCFF